MFNLSEIFQNAQGGQAIDNLAQQFGVSPQQAQSAVQALIPAISSGLLQKVGQPGALGGVLSALGDADHQAAFASGGAAQSDSTLQKGNDAVANVFGSNDVVQQVAQHAANATGLDPSLISQMLPVVMSIALGGVASAAQNQGFGGMLGQLAGAAEQASSGATGGGGLMGMVSGVLGGLFGGSASAPQQTGASTDSETGAGASSGALDGLTKLLQPGTLPPEIAQSGLVDQLGKLFGGDKS